MDYDSVVKLLIALLLVLLNGFFVAAEFSIVKVRYSQIQIKAAEGNKMAKQAEHIIKHLDAYLSATQLGITLASLALGWVGESALEHVFHGIFSYFNINIAPTMITTISVVVSFLIITVMHIVFGELVPKSIAIRKSEATTLFISAPLRLFYNIFKPFIWLMNLFSNAFLKLIGIHPASEHDIHSTEELQLLVKQSADSGEIEEENYEIIKNAFDFTDHTAKQVMVPRQNIISIDIEDEYKNYFGEKDSLKFSKKEETVKFIYNAIACPCAQWSNFNDKKSIEKFYLVNDKNLTQNAEDFWDGTSLPLIVEATGVFSENKSVPKDFPPKGYAEREKSKIFKYRKIRLIQLGNKKY